MAESSVFTVSLHVPSWATALQVVWWTLVESFLQSMMETIAAAIASKRVRLVASTPRPSFALRSSFFIDQTAAASLLQNPSTTTKYNTRRHCCYRLAAVPRLTISPSCQSDICRVSLTHQAEIYIATLVDFAGQGIFQAHTPSH